jgi:putative membrane protein
MWRELEVIGASSSTARARSGLLDARDWRASSRDHSIDRMMLRLTLAWLHLVALGIGLGAIVARARAIRGTLDTARLRRVFFADSAWGIAALLWISTGLWRLLAGTEKPTGYYVASHAFRAKMGLLVLILVLEAWPMVTLIRWRMRVARGTFAPDASAARRIAAISYVQAALVVLMVAAAVAMARGFWAGG